MSRTVSCVYTKQDIYKQQAIRYGANNFVVKINFINMYSLRDWKPIVYIFLVVSVLAKKFTNQPFPHTPAYL